MGSGRPRGRTLGAWISRTLRSLDDAVMRTLDVAFAATLLLLLALPILALALAVRLESPGPALYRSRRVGVGGRVFVMLKFRKMPDGAGGSPLTAPEDVRFTRLGHFLARTKLDELPQLLNVVRGEMSLVGPRPEDPHFVERMREELEPVLRVRPGITGLSQIAFARESEILDSTNRESDYVGRILPQKIHLDTMYVSRRSTRLNLRILTWTAVAVLLRREVAVNRTTAKLGLRRRPTRELATQKPKPSPAEAAALEPIAVEAGSLEPSPVPLPQTGS
jgi:lipopolysaccharide/colanic/teichoic acid biosynthesis glycosyltransferase